MLHVAARRLTRGAAAFGVFSAAFVWQFGEVDFHNDHFYVIAGARQMLYGELPYRDFFDQGEPLQFLTSMAAMRLFGEGLLAEALVCVGFFALGATLAFLLATRISGSIWLGLLAALFVAACSVRLLNYQKLVLPLLALLVLWRYAERPGWWSLGLVALTTAVATLFRHDFALYVGTAAIATLIATHGWRDWAMLWRRTAGYAALTVALLAPWLAFLEANGGVAQYAGDVMAFGQREASRLGMLTLWRGPRPAFAFDGGRPLVELREPRPQPPPEVSVRWVPGVGEETRARLEQRYGLVAARPTKPRTWQYHLEDRSEANIRALVGDRRVEDTLNIDEERYRLREPPTVPWVAWQRDVAALRVHPLPGLIHERNALPWLYYVLHALPLAACARLAYRSLGSTRPGVPTRAEMAMVLSASVLLAISTQLLVRKPMEGRVLEVFGTASVLGAWLIADWLRGGRAATRTLRGNGPAMWSRVASGARWAVVGSVLSLSWLSVATLANFDTRLERSGILEGPAALSARLVETYEKLKPAPPVDAWSDDSPTGGRALARYVAACTQPDDRILVLSWTVQIYYYSGRLFGGAHAFIEEGYWSSPEHQERSLRRLRAQSVPVVLWPVGMDRAVTTDFHLIYDHLATRYAVAAESSFGGNADDVWRVLVQRDRTPLRTYELLGLPCFT